MNILGKIWAYWAKHEHTGLNFCSGKLSFWGMQGDFVMPVSLVHGRHCLNYMKGGMRNNPETHSKYWKPKLLSFVNRKEELSVGQNWSCFHSPILMCLRWFASFGLMEDSGCANGHVELCTAMNCAFTLRKVSLQKILRVVLTELLDLRRLGLGKIFMNLSLGMT